MLGSNTRAAGQAEPGYGTAVETAAQGLADAGPVGAAVLEQGVATGGSRGRAFGKVTENEDPPPPPPPFLFIRLRGSRKATRANFATIAKSDSFTCKNIKFENLI